MAGHVQVDRSDGADLPDDAYRWLEQRLAQFGMRASRAIVVSLVSVWLSASQTHVDYSEWRIAVLVFVFSTLNRFQWIGVFIVGWLVVLYLAPPDITASIKALR